MVGTLQGDVAALEGEVDNLDQRVTTLELGGSSEGLASRETSTATAAQLGMFPTATFLDFIGYPKTALLYSVTCNQAA